MTWRWTGRVDSDKGLAARLADRAEMGLFEPGLELEAVAQQPVEADMGGPDGGKAIGERAEGQTGVFGSVRAISFEAYYEGFES